MSSISTRLEIAPATRADIPLIRQLILELAEYERALPGEAPVTEKDLAETLFDEHPVAEVIIAYLDNLPVGFALFFHNYSTWLGKRGIYLEDLFVRSAARKHGVGFSLLKSLGRVALDCGFDRVHSALFNWDLLRINFHLPDESQTLDW